MNIKEAKYKIMESFIDELPRIRKEMNVSQEKFGELVGLSRQTISLIERREQPLEWTNFLAMLMIISFKSEKVYYFPDSKNYKYYDSLLKIFEANNSKEDIL